MIRRPSGQWIEELYEHRRRPRLFARPTRARHYSSLPTACSEDALGKIAEVGGLALIHAERNHLVEATVQALARRGKTSAAFHPESRPTVCEVDAVQAVFNMLRVTGAMGYFVHISTPEALEIVRTAQGDGVKVWAETCPHYLILDDEAYGSEQGALYVCSPPLRSRRQAQELWRKLLLGE